MRENPQYYTALFNKLLKKELSPDDTKALQEWLSSDVVDMTAARLILQRLEQPVAPQQISDELMATLNAKLPAILGQQRRPAIPFYKKKWVRYAAACLVVLASTAAFWLSRNPAPLSVANVHQPVKNDVAPGSEGAILTLADGRKVVLDSMGNGTIATQDGSTIVLKNGQLVYDAAGQSAVMAAAYNTMTTPKGRQFKLQLPDGTSVWLNAASSLRYPVTFAGKERKVEVKGEAYFEVAKLTDPATGKRIPFKVQVNEQTAIEVLGTHFNVNSYEEEESVNTTLLEGAVNVFNKGKSVLLKPGQQARIPGANRQSYKSNIEVEPHADVEKVMAWKNGVFNFQDASLAEVMRQLERWYNIDVVYEKGIPKLEFIGKMGRDLPLSDVLRGLEMSKVHFRMEEGRRVVVLP